MPLPAILRFSTKEKLIDALGTDNEKVTPDKPEDVGERRHGIEKIEMLYRVFPKNSVAVWVLYTSLFLYVYLYTLASSTVYSFYTFATSSFGEHAFLSTISVMTGIIGGVSQPFATQLADTTSRPTAYAISLFLYVLGFIIVAASNNVQAIAAGYLLYTIGSVGLDMVTSLLVADISPLKWRGFVTALPSAPYIVNAYISGFITDGLGAAGWRWGYGMFAIMVPVAMSPALAVLFYADIKGRRIAAADRSSNTADEPAPESRSPVVVAMKIWSALDAFGLILLAFSWTLILLPFTLAAGAVDGYRNPSMIAMFVVGGILLIAFGIYEWFFAANPILPMRILNRAFVCGVIIDSFYYLSEEFAGTYYTSWTYVVTNFNLYDWTIFSNTESVGLCVWGLAAGLAMRYTHRYKWLLVISWVIRILCYGVMYHARGKNATPVELAWTQVLNGLGGGISIVCVNVMVQASVPHEDLGIVIANLALWTKLTGAISAAVAGAVWTNDMPANLNKYLTPLGVNATDIATIYGSIAIARDESDTIRAGVIEAYDDTVKPLIIASLATSFIPLLAALFTTNFYLGETQNAVDGKLHPMYRHGETPASDESSSNDDDKSAISEKETAQESA